MYVYQEQKKHQLAADEVATFEAIQRAAGKLVAAAGAARMQEIWAEANASGDAWFMLACVDRLVELGLLREVTPAGTWGQYRVFVAGSGRALTGTPVRSLTD